MRKTKATQSKPEQTFLFTPEDFFTFLRSHSFMNKAHYVFCSVSRIQRTLPCFIIKDLF